MSDPGTPGAPGSAAAAGLGDQRLARFSGGERWVHRTLGVLMLVCMVSAAFLYLDVLSAAVGRREFISTVHFVSGLLLPVPLVVGALISPAFRADVRRLNRFIPADWRWLRSSALGRRGLLIGKFNAGQKLNSSFVLGSVLLLLATGLMLRYFGAFADSTRTGATFVHDVVSLALIAVSIGHLGKAWADPEARVGMRTGTVSPDWAREEHPLWAAELERQRAGSSGASGQEQG
ncbi:unannotated protein [freshwater metagenome]|uniref:Unannotated protein n=1 Tax=freshwater metagenome TaxID=449393 RepID=A0A6J7JMM4_9ZZZZ